MNLYFTSEIRSCLDQFCARVKRVVTVFNSTMEMRKRSRRRVPQSA